MISQDDSKTQAKDTGLAMLLICLLFIYLAKYYFLLLPAMAILVVTMTCPSVLTPFAKLWFGLSRLMGIVMSKVVLSLIYFIVVLPIGFFRRIIGKDAMQVRAWRSSSGSVFKMKNHVYSGDDLEKPY
ncbi:MAG: hypothetical protein JZU65_23155 [Chlorobium sp.]|nr:hypothetical protein [Chlorobium sp.]